MSEFGGRRFTQIIAGRFGQTTYIDPLLVFSEFDGQEILEEG
jgi:hypothetical protein